MVVLDSLIDTDASYHLVFLSSPCLHFVFFSPCHLLLILVSPCHRLVIIYFPVFFLPQALYVTIVQPRRGLTMLWACTIDRGPGLPTLLSLLATAGNSPRPPHPSQIPIQNCRVKSPVKFTLPVKCTLPAAKPNPPNLTYH